MPQQELDLLEIPARLPAELRAGAAEIVGTEALDPNLFGGLLDHRPDGADDLAEDIADDNEQRSAEEVLLSTIDNTTDDKLTRFALRLALSEHVGIPRENEFDFLAEAEAVFAPQLPKKAKKPTPIKANKSTIKKAAKRKVAA